MDVDLFLQDMESQFDAELRRSREEAIVELTSVERLSVSLAARVLACEGKVVEVWLRGGMRIDGTVVDAARTWILVETDTHSCLVPLSAVAAITPLGHASIEENAVARSVTMGHILRALCDDRAPLVIDHDAGSYSCVITGVFADHMDVDVRSAGFVRDSRDRSRAARMSLSTYGVLCLRFDRGALV